MFRSQLSQFFPPKPTFSEADIGPQTGRVFLVTGGASGIGFELCKTLYSKGARVYIAGRSKENAEQAIRTIQSDVPSSEGSTASLDFLHIDLADLTTIKAAADAFRYKESRLDVLWHNAGVSQPPPGSLSAQGYELQLATNCLGPFLLTELLLPLLESTAARADTPPASVRVVWTSSQMMELSAPPEGLLLSELDTPPTDTTRAYVNSKTGNFLLSAELARRQSSRSSPVVSVSLNPGAASTNLFRHTPSLRYLAWPLLYSAEKAALTQLYAGLSGEITLETNGCYVVPWGRIAEHVRPNLVEAAKSKQEGGTGRAEEFWEYCERKVKEYR